MEVIIQRPGRWFLTAIGRSQDPIHAERIQPLHSSLFQRFLCLKRILDLFTLENVKLIHACTLREAFKKKTSYLVTLSKRGGRGQNEITILGALEIMTYLEGRGVVQN